MRIAYLVNVYPAPSHSFIRREIAGLRKLGVDPKLISIRAYAGKLPDADDLADEKRTTVVLHQPHRTLLWTLAVTVLRHPLRSTSAFVKACRQYVQTDNAVRRVVGYYLEACYIRTLLDRERIQHLHAHMGSNAASVAQLVYWLGGPGYSLTIHGPEEFDDGQLLCLSSKLRDALFTVAVSQYTCKRLQNDYAGTRHKIHMIRCGVDRSFFAPFEQPPPVMDVSRLVSVGRLTHRKNHQSLIAAIALVRAECPSIQLTIIGDGEQFKLLQDQIRELGLDQHVQLLGTLDSKQVRSHMLSARALVLPSLAETLPCVIMEAFALGRPVVCTRVGACDELVRNGENGWLISNITPAAIAAAIMEVLKTPTDQLSQMGQNGAALVRRDYGAEAQAGKLAQLMWDYVSERSAREAATSEPPAVMPSLDGEAQGRR